MWIKTEDSQLVNTEMVRDIRVHTISEELWQVACTTTGESGRLYRKTLYQTGIRKRAEEMFERIFHAMEEGESRFDVEHNKHLIERGEADDIGLLLRGHTREDARIADIWSCWTDYRFRPGEVSWLLALARLVKQGE